MTQPHPAPVPSPGGEGWPKAGEGCAAEDERMMGPPRAPEQPESAASRESDGMRADRDTPRRTPDGTSRGGGGGTRPYHSMDRPRLPLAAPVGVLALQGDFARHAEALARAGLESREIRRVDELASVSGLVLPGGESTTYLKFFEREPGWGEALRKFAGSGKPMLATCAGLILISARVDNPPQASLALLDVDVVRNAYGRQVDSFVGKATDTEGTSMEAVFIRAPKIARVGPSVEVLAREANDPVLVRSGNVFGATFHPELSEEPAVHRRIFGAVGSGVDAAVPAPAGRADSGVGSR
jgi:5'-phosphate synthase pdxT subunit